MLNSGVMSQPTYIECVQGIAEPREAKGDGCKIKNRSKVLCKEISYKRLLASGYSTGGFKSLS